MRDEMREQKDVAIKKAMKKNVANFDPAGILRNCKCFDEIVEMIYNGRYTRDIVAFIHEQGELGHVSKQGLRFRVQRLKDALLTDTGVPDERAIAKGEDYDESDPVAIGHILRKMFHAHAKRVEMETETEMSLTKLFAGTHKEYLTAYSMGERLIKVLKELDMFDVNSETGSVRVKENIDSVMENPESRHKLLGIVDLIMKNPEMFKNVTSLDAAREKKNRPKRNQGQKEKKAQ
jgi:hypothetical protein